MLALEAWDAVGHTNTMVSEQYARMLDKGVNRDATVSCVVAIWIMLCTHLQGGMADGRVSCAWG